MVVLERGLEGWGNGIEQPVAEITLSSLIMKA